MNLLPLFCVVCYVSMPTILIYLANPAMYIVQESCFPKQIEATYSVSFLNENLF